MPRSPYAPRSIAKACGLRLKRSQGDRWVGVIHESGHAVVGVLLGCRLNHVRVSSFIKANQTVFDNLFTYDAATETDEQCRRRITMTLMAGPAAEQLQFGGLHAWETNTDMSTAVGYINATENELLEKMAARFRETCEFLRAHRGESAAVIRSLEEHGSLTGYDVEKLLASAAPRRSAPEQMTLFSQGDA